MKCLCIALCLVAVVLMAEGFPSYGGCEDSDDCGDVGCCVRVGGPWYKMTKCKPYKREGKKCMPAGPKNGVYDFQCPCAEGLECVGEVKVKPTSSDNDSSSSESEELVYKCRAEATPPPPKASSAEPEQEHSEGPHVASEEPVVEEEKIEIAEPIA